MTAMEHRKSKARGGRWIAAGLLGGLLLAAAAGAAQAAGEAAGEAPRNPLGGFATNPDQPIEIEADRLDVEDKTQTATFIGNVIATQGDMKLRSDRLKAVYARKAGSNAADGGSQIKEIVATGNVHVLSKDDQSADGDWARYVVSSRNIVMGDRVVLRQGENVIRGTKLFIDLNSGKSRIVGADEAGTAKPGENGRVKALFQTPSKEKK
jgi:lipopolysaccharide export system protein LptA